MYNKSTTRLGNILQLQLFQRQAQKRLFRADQWQALHLARQIVAMPLTPVNRTVIKYTSDTSFK
jgi:hypothetical protein